MTYKTGQLASKAVLTSPDNIEPFVLKKQATGDRDTTGVYVPGAVSNFDLEGSVQPLDGKSREELPEAERLMDSLCFL